MSATLNRCAKRSKLHCPVNHSSKILDALERDAVLGHRPFGAAQAIPPCVATGRPYHGSSFPPVLRANAVLSLTDWILGRRKGGAK